MSDIDVDLTNNDIAKINHYNDRLSVEVSQSPRPYLSIMDIKAYVEKFNINRQVLADKSGLTYRRITNILGNSGKYTIQENEKELLKKAIIELVQEMNEELLKNVK